MFKKKSVLGSIWALFITNFLSPISHPDSEKLNCILTLFFKLISSSRQNVSFYSQWLNFCVDWSYDDDGKGDERGEIFFLIQSKLSQVIIFILVTQLLFLLPLNLNKTANFTSYHSFIPCLLLLLLNFFTTMFTCSSFLHLSCYFFFNFEHFLYIFLFLVNKILKILSN